MDYSALVDIESIDWPKGNSFAGNPMIVRIKSTISREFTITVGIGTDEISLTANPANLSYPFYTEFDIADILKDYFEDVHIQAGDIISPLENFMLAYKIFLLKIPEGQGHITIPPYLWHLLKPFEGYAFKGGVNNKNLKRFNYLDTDMFSYRLKEYKRQFLFTTRTNSKQFHLKQTELFPFIFIHPGKIISFVTSSGKNITPEVMPEDTVCTLDVNALRKMFYNVYGELPAYFAVMVDGVFSFDITLLPGQIAEERYFLLFKNSIGGYEKVEITGKTDNTFEFLEENTWLSPNEVNEMEYHRDRLITRTVLTAQTGYKSPEDLSFLLDLIKSDEIYFINPYNNIVIPERCKVTAEDFKYPIRQVSPQSVTLKIQFLSEDQFESPTIVFEPEQAIFTNLTRPGAPEWNKDGFIYKDDYMLYSE